MHDDAQEGGQRDGAGHSGDTVQETSLWVVKHRRVFLAQSVGKKNPAGQRQRDRHTQDKKQRSQLRGVGNVGASHAQRDADDSHDDEPLLVTSGHQRGCLLLVRARSVGGDGGALDELRAVVHDSDGSGRGHSRRH